MPEIPVPKNGTQFLNDCEGCRFAGCPKSRCPRFQEPAGGKMYHRNVPGDLRYATPLPLISAHDCSTCFKSLQVCTSRPSALSPGKMLAYSGGPEVRSTRSRCDKRASRSSGIPATDSSVRTGSPEFRRMPRSEVGSVRLRYTGGPGYATGRDVRAICPECRNTGERPHSTPSECSGTPECQFAPVGFHHVRYWCCPQH